MRIVPLLLLSLYTAGAGAQAPAGGLPASVTPAIDAKVQAGALPDAAAAEQQRFLGRDPEAYSIVSVAKGLSAHKQMYVLPLTYSKDYHGEESELVFQFSVKQRLFNRNLYFGYTQKSFWQMLNSEKSALFRESNYNPELFYRWVPDPVKFHHLGADIGFEHESNGRDFPESRSWNRLYVAPFQARGQYLAYLKLWYRIPEDARTDPDSPKGDDNPDIDRYYGYGEFFFSRQFARKQQIAALTRFNPSSGRGAIQLTYSIPDSHNSLFYTAMIWHGYGESLIDYNNATTRIGVGIMFSR